MLDFVTLLGSSIFFQNLPGISVGPSSILPHSFFWRFANTFYTTYRKQYDTICQLLEKKKITNSLHKLKYYTSRGKKCSKSFFLFLQLQPCQVCLKVTTTLFCTHLDLDLLRVCGILKVFKRNDCCCLLFMYYITYMSCQNDVIHRLQLAHNIQHPCYLY